MIIPVYVIDTNKIDVSSLLSSKELECFSSITNEQTRREKIASYYLKKKYVGDFKIDEYGKPINERLFFNVSHSHGLVMLAVSKHYPIGIDIELIRDLNENLISYVTSDEERSLVSDNISFFEIWTSKESLLKCDGTGINSKLKIVPALPINGFKNYKDKVFASRVTRYKNYIVSVTLEGNIKEFEIEFQK